MTFDATLPSNSTKIRNYPTVLNDNFAAIEQGDLTLKHWQVNFIERNAVPGGPPPANDPTRDDDTIILFSKQDGAGETELFVLDDRNPANNFQITEAGNLGSTSTDISAQNITFDGTYLNTQDAMCSAWAVVASDGSLTSGYGLTSAKNSTGDYTLTFSTALSSANYIAVGTVFTTVTRARVLYVYDRLAGSFSVRTQAVNASAGSYEDNAFMVTVFGGR